MEVSLIDKIIPNPSKAGGTLYFTLKSTSLATYYRVLLKPPTTVLPPLTTYHLPTFPPTDYQQNN